MTPRLMFVVLAFLGQTGCVAAIPMATQLVSGTNSAAQLCSMATIPGQTGSLCDKLPFGAALQAQAVQPAQGTARAANLSTAAR